MKRKIQVFVSSTYNDLIIERQAAVAAILKAGHIPAGMELFTAGDKSQMETIERWIDESGVYMLILGGRYGSIEPTSGVSYTELEDDYAVQQGKPLFAVVIKDEALENKVKTIGTTMIEKENPKALQLFRNKVLSNISSFFMDEKDIRLCIYESLADHALNPSIKGWISSEEVEDTKPLHEEISRLKDELGRAKAGAAKVSVTTSVQKESSTREDFNDLIHILNETEVKVPASLTPEKKQDDASTLLTLFTYNKDFLINGVTNESSITEAESFFYFNICPKLMVHGLVSNEKVPGARYRRSYVNGRGLALLADVERRLKKKKEPAEIASAAKPT